MTTPALPHATYRLFSKSGKADCGIAALATLLRRDPGEVLAMAARIRPSVWAAGLAATEMARICRRFKIKAKWTTTFDGDEDTGVLWISYHDSTREHAVALIDGRIYDPEHDPISLWRYDEFCAANNAYGNQLLVMED